MNYNATKLETQHGERLTLSKRHLKPFLTQNIKYYCPPCQVRTEGNNTTKKTSPPTPLCPHPNPLPQGEGVRGEGSQVPPFPSRGLGGLGQLSLSGIGAEGGYPPKLARNPLSLIPNLILGASLVLAACTSATAQSTNFVVVVNSNQDGDVQPDDALTLREAIEIVNGQLNVEGLSEAEKALVQPLESNTPSRIEFNLPPDQTTIRLQEILPSLASPGLVVDGTTQPGYDATRSATAEIAIPIPVVAIAPASDRNILRGLTIVADGVTVRGLSIYGFKKLRERTLSTPPADILIAHSSPPPDTSQQRPPNRNFPFYQSDIPPKDVLIELNWLGIPPDEAMPEIPSTFGVSVFNSLGTTIQRNRIANHEGSGIITSVQATNLLVTDNIIVGNGIAGMPDAIRLEGIIDNSQINGNLICGNDGSGVYLFKPEGAVQIRDNQISFNGRRLRRAAVYLMGDNNQVIGNQISNQSGPGVVVTAYPKSNGNIIETNRFGELEGLSIDLNTQQNVGVLDFQIGDGHNLPRNSPNRRKETGNSAINAPQFLRSEFSADGSQLTLTGQADSGSSVELYRVTENTLIPYGPLNEPLTTVSTDEQGQFSVTLTNLQPGDKISAIATHPEYGTSEPALNAAPQALTGSQVRRLTGSTFQPPNLLTSQPSNLPTSQPSNPVIPQCTTRPELVREPEPEPEPAPEPLTLRVPRNVHFALDQSTISPTTATILDQIVAVLKSYPFLTVEMQGHADPRASNAYNLALANRRALAVRNYLLRQGIAPERMTIRSFGETQRRTTGSDRLDYARDRRVEFIFYDARGLNIIFEDQESDLQVEPAGGTR